ncbi:calcium-binding protein, partial [Stappia taiwanensis]|uniref:calcium-binding protein n=1 Tax=Stappia taiwanensis TaxID=992267 RepID=UPI0024564E53
MAFDPGSANGINKPENWFGISTYTYSTGRERTAWDAAHGTGDKFWQREILAYQNKLDPDGHFQFNQNARWNGALISHGTDDAGIAGTTAHGAHGGPVNELSWSSDRLRPSFLQTVEVEFDEKFKILKFELEEGEITESEFYRRVKDARIEAIKDHIAFTKTLEAGYLRQDILNKAGHSDIKHIAITAKDPEFADKAEVDAHNESIRDSYSRDALAGERVNPGDPNDFTRSGGNTLYLKNRELVDAEFDAVLRQDVITVQDISEADKRLNVRLVESMADYARIFPEVPAPDEVRARILAEQKIWQASPDDAKETVKKITTDAKAEVDALESRILADLKDPSLYGTNSKKPVSLQDYLDTTARLNIKNDGIEEGVKQIVERQKASYSAIKAVAPDVVQHVEQNILHANTEQELGKIAADGKLSTAAKAGAAAGVLSAFFAGLFIYTEYRAETRDEPEPFDEFLARKGPELIASSGALAIIGAGALTVAAVVPGGALLLLLTAGAPVAYTEFKQFLNNYVTAYENREAGPLPDPNAHYEQSGASINDVGDFSQDDFSVQLAKSILGFLEKIEKSSIGQMVAAVGAAFFKEVVQPFFEALVPSVSVVNGYQVKLVDEDGGWLVGEDVSILVGDDTDNVLFHFGAGEVYGRGGNDWLVSYKPDFVRKGEYLLEADRNKEEANQGLPENEQFVIDGPRAEQDYRLLMDGGEGDDVLIALGGTGAILVGGEGRDFLFNTSYWGQLYGDTIDGQGQNTSGVEDSDVFWYWPNTFIMDAQPNDILQMFGFPLLGGTNSVVGLSVGDGSLAMDWMFPFVFYGASTSGQLLVYNAITDALGLGGIMVVENYDFGGFKPDSWAVPQAGDLGMTFRISGGENAEEISLWGFVWGEFISRVNVFFNFAKAVAWQPVDDPIVLDLDGDGVETVSVSQSNVHFDMDGDYFREKTGWLSSDDGFLVLDRDGNGKVDDITEMFGAPGIGGYQELAALDMAEQGGNGDGVLTIDDALFEELLVWRDLDQDGETDTGELFTLEELDIVSINLGSTALDHVTPQGTILRETASFTRGDGSEGSSYEAVFETDATDTIYCGDTGTAVWLKHEAVPTAKGFGSMAELRVDISNDFELAQIVAGAAAAMTVPTLKDLREQATPVFGAWSQSLELTRELAPVLLGQDGEGNTVLVDRGVYVEDATGGYWTLESGAPVKDGNGDDIVRPSLEEVLAQASGAGEAWQLEQVYSPSSRAAAPEHRDNAPYLVEVVDGRAVIQDYGIQSEDGSWRLASGTEVTDADGAVIAAPTLDDVLAMAHAEGTEWRVEEIGFNPFAALPVDQIGVQLIDGVVTDYSVQVTDADGTFQVWARNLDRALELQHKLGRPGEFNLRNYELDFDTLDEVGSTDDSAYRVELMTAGQLHFASSIYGTDFQPQIMWAETDPETGVLSYSAGSFNSEDAPTETEDGAYLSTIKPAIGLFDVMMQNYITASRAFAVRLALQGGLSDFAPELEYDAQRDEFRAIGDRELAPMFEAIFAGAPAGADAAYDYLTDWHEILQVIYPDYHVDASVNFLTGGMKLDQKFVFQMIIPAFENVGIDLDLKAAMNALGVDETLLVAHDAAAAVAEGTTGNDYFYVTGSDRSYEGGAGQDIYFAGKDFGSAVIDDREEPLRPHSNDELRFAQAKSTDIRATQDGRDLVLEVVGTDDVIRVKDQFLGDLLDPLFGYNFAPDTGVTSIIFADGVIWSQLEIAQAVSHPLDSDDLVLGSEIRDWIQGGRGNDVLRGGRDGDIYIFREGDGHDRIDEQNDRPLDDNIKGAGNADILQFTGEGLKPDNISFRRAGESDDLEMVIVDDDGNETGDSMRIDGQFAWANTLFFGLIWSNRVERIGFQDGSFLTEADVMARVLEEAGTDGSDIIYGFNNDDTLDGGAGDDVLTGRAQSDTYIFGRGYGSDVIADGHDDFFGTGFDVLKFKDDLRWSDFEFQRDGASPTITMRVSGTNDEVILDDQFENSILGFTNMIEEIQFGDGTAWSYARLGQHVIDLARSDGDDIIYGFDIADRLDGGLGNDRLEGGAASDIYVFARGYGNDTVFDTTSSGQGDEVILQDIVFLDVDVSREDNDLVFTIRDTGERLVLENQYVRSGAQTHAIETFRFSDRDVSFTDLKPEDVDLVGTSASETLTGSDFAEAIDGRGGDDTLIGNSDGDTYIFGIGYGQDVIVDTQKRVSWVTREGTLVKETDDTVRFREGVTIDNLIFTKDGDDLVMSITDHPDTLRVKNQFASIARGIEWFEFDGGERLHISDVEERLAIVGGSRGDDVIEGALDSENTLDGRQGDDELEGGRLGDTYAFGAAYDLDTIVERTDGVEGAIDKVVFGAIVDPDTVRLIRDGDDLIIDLGNGEDRLTITEGLTTRQVEKFLFANGVEWDLEDVRDRLLTGTEGDDVLVGFDDRDDQLDGRTGSDAMEGGLGNDTYVFGLGSDDDSVKDTGGFDRIEFGANVIAAQIEFSNEDGDLLIGLKSESDTLIILGGAVAGGSQRIEEFVFEDGTVISIDEILRELVRGQTTSGSDVIDARDVGAIEIEAGAGDDLVTGGDETTFAFRAGDGSDIVDTRGEPGSSRIEFYDLEASEAVVRKPDIGGSDVLISFPNSGDQILVRGAFSNANVDTIRFADGVEWTREELVAQAILSQQTDSGDAITGSALDDRIEGGLGDDDIAGGAGNDVYMFRAGDGRDVIQDNSGTDRVEIRGYRPSEVQVSRPVEDRDEWLLRFAQSDDEILLRGTGIETIAFGDGTEWTLAQVQAMAVGQGTQFNDVLEGSDTANTMAGLEGDDLLSGKAGSDIYVFRRGDGQDIIDDQGASSDVNELHISDYVLSDATLIRYEDRRDDLILRFSDTDAIIVAGAFFENGSHITKFLFEDGTEVSVADILDKLDVIASEGDQIITGTSASETFIGGLGNDQISGGDGSDTYIFRRGDGQDTIEDNGYYDTDVLRLEGYSLADAIFSKSIAANETLVLSFVSTTDRITVVNGLSNSSQNRIEEYRFDDVTWSTAQIVERINQAQTSDGDDRIAGLDDFNETLVGGLGNDYLTGGKGSDTYIFRKGDGQDTIEENGYYDTDVLSLEGYRLADAIFSKSIASNSTLLINFAESADQITIINGLASSSWDRIEEYRFDDGTLSTAQIVERINQSTTTDGNDRITGFEEFADTLIGGLGDDYLSGGDGADTYIFHRGDGRDTIRENGEYDTDVVKVEGYSLADVVFERSIADNNTLVLKFDGTSDQITVVNGLGHYIWDRVEQYQFDDGTLNAAQIVDLINQGQATDGNDRITGFGEFADTLSGGLGN